MIGRIAIILALMTQVAFAQSGSAVKQSGNFTPGHVPYIVTNGVIGDGGTAFQGFLTSLGVTASGPAICQNSGPVTGPYNEICLGVTQTGGGTISLFNRNGATGNINFAVNGSPQNVGIVAAPPNSVQYNLAGSLAGVLLGDAQLLVGQSGAPLAKTMSGDATFSDLGALTLNNNISHLTGVGTLTSGATGSGFTVNFAASTLSGNVPLNHGGTNAALTASNGAVPYSTSSALALLPYPSVVGNCLLSGQPPTWGACSGSTGVSSVGNATANTTITIAGTGSGPWTGNVTLKCTIATTSQLGCVEPDGSTVLISAGVLSVPTATSSALGIIKPDNTSVIINAGVLSATGSTLEQNKTSNYSIQTSDNGSAFNNAGASGPVVLSLPACSSSPLAFQGFVNIGQSIEFLANGTDTISAGIIQTAAGGNIQSGSLGSKVTLRCESPGYWSSLRDGSWVVN